MTSLELEEKSKTPRNHSRENYFPNQRVFMVCADEETLVTWVDGSWLEKRGNRL